MILPGVRRWIRISGWLGIFVAYIILQMYNYTHQPMFIVSLITPVLATVKLSLKYFFNKSISLSNPAKNISKITPNSENKVMVWLGCTNDKIAGPKMIPDNNWPMTAGISKRVNNCPKMVVINKIKINSPKKCMNNISFPVKNAPRL